MALIKKYNSGGKANTRDSFSDYVNQRLLTNADNLTIKQQKQLQDLSSAEDFDPNNIKDKTAAKIYEQYTQRAPKTKIVDLSGGKTDKRVVGDLLSDIIKEDFDGNESLALRHIADLSHEDEQGLPTNRGKRIYFLNKAKQKALKYIKASEQDTSGSTWDKIDHVRELNEMISSINPDSFTDEDYDKVASKAAFINWDLKGYEESPQDLELRRQQIIHKRKQDAENTKKEAQISEAQKVYDLYESIGIKNPQVADHFYSRGFHNVTDEFKPELREYFNKNNFKVLSNGIDNIIWDSTKGNLAEGQGLYTEDVFDKDNYGKGFGIQAGQFVDYDRGALPEGFEIPEYKGISGNVKRGLKLEVMPEGYENWEVYGSPTTSATGKIEVDSLGRPDYFRHLTFRDPTHSKEITAVRDSEGKWKTSRGNIWELNPVGFLDGKIEQFKVDPITDIWNNPQQVKLHAVTPKDPRSAVQRWVGIEPDFSGTINKFERFVKDIDFFISKNQEITTVKPSEFEKTVQAMKWFGIHGTPIQKQKVAEKVTEINRILNLKTKKGNPTFTVRKEGGVLKASEGDVLRKILKDNDMYLDKSIENTNSVGSVASAPKYAPEVFYTGDTVGEMDGWQIASLVGSVASFLPGVGIAGGLVSTVADAVSGSKDGWDGEDWLTLGTNLGFTALAGIGLGGAKAARALGQAGKIAKAGKPVITSSRMARAVVKAPKFGEKVSKTVSKVSKVTDKMGSVGAKIEDVIKGTKTLTPKQLQEVVKVAKTAGYETKGISNAADLLGVLSKDLNLASDVARAQTNIISHVAQQTGHGIVNTIKGTVQAAPKVLKTGFIANQVYQGGTGAFNIAKNIHERDGDFVEGIKASRVQDLRNVTQLGALGIMTYKNRLNQNAYFDNTTEVAEQAAQSGIKVGGQTYKTKADVTQPKKGIFGIFNKGKLSAKETEKLKGTLRDQLVDNSPAVIDEIIAAVNNGAKITPAENLRRAASGVTRVLNRDPDSMSYKDMSRWRRAANIDRTQSANYSGIRRWSWGKNLDIDNMNTYTAPKVIRKPNTYNPYRFPSGKIVGVAPGKANPRSFIAANNNAKFGGIQGQARTFKNRPQLVIPKTAPAPAKPVAPVVPEVVVPKAVVAPKIKAPKTKPVTKTTKKSKTYGKAKNSPKRKNEYIKFKGARVKKSARKNELGGILFAETGVKFTSPYETNRYQLKFTSPYSTREYPISSSEYASDFIKSITTNLPSIYNREWTSSVFPTKPRKFNYSAPTITASPTAKQNEDGTYTYAADGNTGLVFAKGPSNDEVSHLEDHRNRGELSVYTAGNYSPSKRTDTYPIGETIKLANTKAANDASLMNQISAINQVPIHSSPSGMHFRTSASNMLNAEKQRGNLQSLGRRSALGTADYNKGFAMQLEAHRKGEEYVTSAAEKDMAANKATENRQASMDYATNKEQMAAENINRLRRAEAGSAMGKLFANYELKKYANRNQFVSAMSNWKETKGQKDALHRYHDFVYGNPNVRGVTEHLSKLAEDEKVFRDRFEEASKTEGWDSNLAFEDSTYGKEWLRHKNHFIDNYYNPVMTELGLYRDAASTGAPYYGRNPVRYKKGGKLSFEEKVALENIKSNNRKMSKHQELVYKQVLNNAVLLEKTLLKVFK